MLRKNIFTGAVAAPSDLAVAPAAAALAAAAAAALDAAAAAAAAVAAVSTVAASTLASTLAASIGAAVSDPLAEFHGRLRDPARRHWTVRREVAGV